jgi:DNA processing protein
MNTELFYQLALTFVPHVGPAQAKILLQHYEAPDLFGAKKSDLARIEGIGTLRAESIGQFNDFALVEREMQFLENNEIRALFLTDPDYPQRLLHCYDPPTLLFYRGQANLNAERVVSIVGKRHPTGYGQEITKQVVKFLARMQIVIVSGLSVGTDAIAHQAAMENKLPTVGVLAHGLDSIYPLAHHYLAQQMVRQGGLLTEIRHKTGPGPALSHRHHRIVAGLSDAVIVIESEMTGGSLITAQLAAGYYREVFAVPGRVNEPTSAGCHYLIRTQQAILFEGIESFLTSMNWNRHLTPYGAAQ